MELDEIGPIEALGYLADERLLTDQLRGCEEIIASHEAQLARLKHDLAAKRSFVADLKALRDRGEIWKSNVIFLDEWVSGRVIITGVGHRRIAELWPVARPNTQAWGVTINEYFVNGGNHRFFGGAIIGNQWDENQTKEVALELAKDWVVLGDEVLEKR